MKGLILAAGVGSRLKPWTDYHPKALAPIGPAPALEYAIRNMQEAGIKEIIINVHHFSSQIIEYLSIRNFNSLGLKILISDESDLLRDTGGAIVHAAELIGDDSIVIQNADIYTDIKINDIINYHNLQGCDVTMLVSDRTSSRQLVFNNQMRLKGWINNQTLETLPTDLKISAADLKLSFNGIHVLSHKALHTIFETSSQPVFSIIPMYVNLCSSLCIKGYLPTASNYTWIDIGTPEKLARAQEAYRLNHELTDRQVL